MSLLDAEATFVDFESFDGPSALAKSKHSTSPIWISALLNVSLHLSARDGRMRVAAIPASLLLKHKWLADVNRRMPIRARNRSARENIQQYRAMLFLSAKWKVERNLNLAWREDVSCGKPAGVHASSSMGQQKRARASAAVPSGNGNKGKKNCCRSSWIFQLQAGAECWNSAIKCQLYVTYNGGGAGGKFLRPPIGFEEGRRSKRNFIHIFRSSLFQNESDHCQGNNVTNCLLKIGTFGECKHVAPRFAFRRKLLPITNFLLVFPPTSFEGKFSVLSTCGNLASKHVKNRPRRNAAQAHQQQWKLIWCSARCWKSQRWTWQIYFW